MTISKSQIFKKAGNHNYREKKLVEKIMQALEEKIKTNPDIMNSITPATNIAELQAMANELVPTDVNFEEVKTDKVETPTNTIENQNTEGFDPLNREEPKVRDYVLDAQQNTLHGSGESRTTFNEPLTLEEAFEIPDEPLNPNDGSSTQSSGQNQNQRTQQKNIQKQQQPNPEMSAGAQRKQTAKFAKYLVEAVCMLQEKGFIWYATKDINEAKLTEYEISGEMDLSLLLTLNENEEVSIKEFFKRQCILAEQAAKIDQDQKNDLTEALIEVLLEKNIAPSKSQNLMIVGLSIVMTQGLSLIAITAQNKAVLSQLRAMNDENRQGQKASAEQLRREQEAQRKREEERIANADKVAKGETVTSNKNPEPKPEPQQPQVVTPTSIETIVEEGPIINVEIETKE